MLQGLRDAHQQIVSGSLAFAVVDDLQVVDIDQGQGKWNTHRPELGKLMTQHGRYVHSHWDGNSRQLLPYLKDSGLHAVEALTVEPMGDMTLEGIKQATGDEIIVLDMIPVIYFLPNYPVADLMDFVKKVIDMFAPKLILGVSDELSSPCEIDRIDMIADLIDKTCGLAT